jgi:hypothetical protein
MMRATSCLHMCACIQPAMCTTTTTPQVRSGKGGMPRFREQKLSDAEVEAVANIVIVKAKANRW